MRLVATLSIALGALLSGCAAPPAPCDDPLGCLLIPPGGSIRIAYLLVFDGPFQSLGNEALGGIELAIQARGGELLGRPIEIAGEEPDCTRESLLKSATKIATRANILGEIGPFCPMDTGPALNVLQNAGLAAIALPETALAAHLDESFPPGVFRLSPSEGAQGRLAAEFAYRALGARHTAVLGESSPYSQNLASSFAQTFRALGGTITRQFSANEGTADFSPFYQQLSADPPDVLYLPLFRRSGDLALRQYRDFPLLNRVALLGGDGLFDRDLYKEAGAPEKMYVTGITLAGESYARFAAEWQAEYGDPPGSSQAALAYDATGILLDSARKVAIIGRSGTLSIGRLALRQAIASLDRYAGLSGPISCRSNGACVTGSSLAVFSIPADKTSPAGKTSGTHWPPPIFWQEEQEGR
jgi:branched-chain amino acid transport system substrate-binding protein